MMFYGPSWLDVFRRAATYVDKKVPSQAICQSNSGPSSSYPYVNEIIKKLSMN